MDLSLLIHTLEFNWLILLKCTYLNRLLAEYGIAPSQLTEKVDVYSFGVVLLELITGRVATGPGVDGQLPIWAPRNRKELMANHLEMFKNTVDKGIPDKAKYLPEMASVFRLGVDCIVRDTQQRPSMLTAHKRLCRSRRRFCSLLSTTRSLS